MVEINDAFPGFSVDDVGVARAFYGDVLGFDVREEMGGLQFSLPSGQGVFVYPKDQHQPATFTILNIVVPDIGAAVDALNAQGVVTKIYADPHSFGTDERGIAWGSKTGQGPDICWFRDPAGNVLSLIQS
ncbi:VOC family protein [Agromyces allii]|uniref:VOC domain-containing protein n=1 Tax=Agromyces allii TaxID=393607 RepID=A0ABP5BNR6_9MICO|nr:VOC family protein [Agromyces allii]